MENLSPDLGMSLGHKKPSPLFSFQSSSCLDFSS